MHGQYVREKEGVDWERAWPWMVKGHHNTQQCCMLRGIFNVVFDDHFYDQNFQFLLTITNLQGCCTDYVCNIKLYFEFNQKKHSLPPNHANGMLTDIVVYWSADQKERHVISRCSVREYTIKCLYIKMKSFCELHTSLSVRHTVEAMFTNPQLYCNVYVVSI